MDVQLFVETTAGNVSTTLANAWVYRKSGTTITVFRTTAAGMVRSLDQNGDAKKPWQYNKTFTVAQGTVLELYFSTGKTPIPSSVLTQNAQAFESITVGAPIAQAAQVGTGGSNALALTPRSRIALTAHTLAFSTPVEPAILPVLFDPPTSAYATNGLSQGAALWTNPAGPGNLTVTEGALAAAPPSAVRPKETAIHVKGTVDAAATAVNIQVLNASDAAVLLLSSGAATTTVSEVAATLAAPNGTTREFEATFIVQDYAAVLGPIRLLAVATGLPRPALEAAWFVLTGMKVALVDDGEAGNAGNTGGPIRGEGDEIIVVDFLASPQPNTQALSNQTRARRMVQYQIRGRARPFNTTTTTPVMKPEMPMWMGEVEFLGLTKAALEELLQRRFHSTTPQKNDIAIAFDWRMRLEWDGPNSGSATRPYSYSREFTGSGTCGVQLKADETVDGLNPDGVLSNAISPAPAAISYPVSTRRKPVARVGVQRPWNRMAGATDVEGLIVEFQPRIEINGIEAIRGGDGELTVTNVRLDGTAIDPGKKVNGANFTAASPDLSVPTYRIVGVLPTAAQVTTLIDTAIHDFFVQNGTNVHVAVLTEAQWVQTARRIIEHESVNSRAFEDRGSGRVNFGGTRFGLENRMPIFGPPAGYGLGQLDNPPVNDDEVWSYHANVVGAVRRIMNDKAQVSHTALGGNFSNPITRLQQGVFQRDVVRRYNGGREMRFHNGAFEIFPQSTTIARIEYPNNVLGTTIVYNGIGGSVAFTIADVGPGI
jgi:hypothetical protein